MHKLVLVLVLVATLLCCQKRPRSQGLPPEQQSEESVNGIAVDGEDPQMPEVEIDTRSESEVEEILEGDEVSEVGGARPPQEPPRVTDAAEFEAQNLVDSKPSPKKKASIGQILFRRGNAAYRAKQLEKAQEFFLSSCQVGYVMACHRYGWHQQGLGNLQDAVRFYEVACRAGIAKSCNNIGWVAEHRKSYHRAKNFYSWACMRQHKRACGNLKRVQAFLIKEKKLKTSATSIAH